MSTIEDVKKSLLARKPSIIAIDGPLASGKSTLANKIAADLGYPCIHVDDFIAHGTGEYFSAIRFESLEEKIASLPRPLILEGVCIIKVMEALNIFPEFLIYSPESNPGYKKRRDKLEREVSQYTAEYLPAEKADLTLRSFNMTTQHDVDIAYLKARTLFSALLALGGIISIIVGAILLSSGLQGNDSAVFKILGSEISAKGIGGVILATSAVWAYLAYRSRPVYRHKKESTKTVGADGSVEEWDSESSTRTLTNAPAKKMDRDS